MFQVPSTPDSRRGDDIDNPSTTPAGPPPTGFTSQSFTPAGRPPPSSVFGGSFANTNGNGLPSKSAFSFSAFVQSPAVVEKAPSNRVPSRGFAVPSSSPGVREASFDYGANELPSREPEPFSLSALQAAEDEVNLELLDFDEPRGSKRLRNGNVMSQSMRASTMFGTGFNKVTKMPTVVDGLVAGMSAPKLTEDDDAILITESILEALDKAARQDPQEQVDQALERAVSELHEEWSHVDPTSISAGIGPAEKDGFTKATYVASLLLQLHHPTHDIVRQSRPNAKAVARSSYDQTPLPKALLDWLNKYHNPFPEDLSEVQHYRPSATAHDRFWDTVFATLLRGRFSEVIELLNKADWSQAHTALDDGYTTPGYKGSQLLAVQHAVAQCVELLRSCPALIDDDWTVTGPDWTLFRSKTRRALEDLEQYAESNSADREYGDVNVFSANSKSFAAGSRRAESKVPWTVYEQLKAIYGQILGSKEEILLSAQDWLEATLYLTVWWDGSEDPPPGASRRGLPARHKERPVDIDPLAVYQWKLLNSFASVTDEPEDQSLGVNTVDPVQVALGAVFEGEVESVLKVLLKWSPLVAAAIVDVASVGNWMPSGRPRTADVMDGFDQEDLMVLSHGQINQKKDLDRDSVLIVLAELLSKEDQMTSQDGKDVQDGWKLAIRILSRLDSASAAHTKIASVFDSMTLSTSKQVDEALSVCNSLGLVEQVRQISERYADSLASSSHSYGQALLYYARAHSEKQLQTTLDLLLSTSIVRSAAYPARTELDPQLEDLLNNSTGVLTQLARIDSEAARLLADKSSGYATLRRFYELRDEDDEADEAENVFRSGLKPAKRKKEMVKGLVALVESAGESIRGGLFDANASGVLQVDSLLALLGEALPLLHEHGALFSKAQLISLLRAVEDLQTVSSRIYEQAETVFQASMSDFVSKRTLEPQDLAKSLRLAKSGSDMSGSAFGMVNSKGSIESEQTGDIVMTEGEADDTRAWDWRRGLALAAGKTAKGSDVLRILRIAIAKEVGRGWAAGR